jgi:hypothetical protein
VSKPVSSKKQSRAKPDAKKFLSSVPYESGFHFFTGIGEYTGITANSLVEFAEKLQTVPVDSVTFHFQRDDFQKWLRSVIGDDELAKRIDRIKEWPRWSSGENLRKDLLKAVEKRLAELKTLRREALP